MKLLLKSFLFLLISFLYEKTAYSISNYEIQKICQNKQNRFYCMKKLKDKKTNLIKGNRIEIPVIPFKN